MGSNITTRSSVPGTRGAQRAVQRYTWSHSHGTAYGIDTRNLKEGRRVSPPDNKHKVKPRALALVALLSNAEHAVAADVATLDRMIVRRPESVPGDHVELARRRRRRQVGRRPEAARRLGRTRIRVVADRAHRAGICAVSQARMIRLKNGTVRERQAEAPAHPRSRSLRRRPHPVGQ